jgi:hypothetical protein
MTGLDARLVPKITKILNKYGKTVSFKSIPIRAYNPNTGRTATAGEDESTGKITPPEPWTLAPLPGSMVQQGDMSTYTQYVAEVGHKVVVDEEIWEVVAIGKVYTGDLVGMYLLQLRL